jgi:hypothetical protein
MIAASLTAAAPSSKTNTSRTTMAASTGPTPVAAPDGYGKQSGDPGFLLCYGARRITWQTANAAIVYQLGHGSPPSFEGEPERPLLPVVGTVAQPCDAIRYRNQTPGVVAQVQIATDP